MVLILLLDKIVDKISINSNMNYRKYFCRKRQLFIISKKAIGVDGFHVSLW